MAEEPTPGNTPAGTPPTPPSNAPWYGTPDAETLGYLQARGLDKLTPDKAALEAVKAHREAEKLIGAPADQLLRLPKDANDAKAWNDVYKKLGVPEKADEYDFSSIKYPDGNKLTDEETAELRSIAADLKLSKNGAILLGQKLLAIAEKGGASAKAEYEGKLAADVQTLKSNWGSNYAANELTAKAAMEKMGFSPDDITALTKVVGHAKIMEGFRNIGARMGEDKFITSQRPGGGAMTAQEAQFKMEQLRNDSAWVERFSKGDALAHREFEDLTKLIASGVTAGRSFA